MWRKAFNYHINYLELQLCMWRGPHEPGSQHCGKRFIKSPTFWTVKTSWQCQQSQKDNTVFHGWKWVYFNFPETSLRQMKFRRTCFCHFQFLGEILSKAILKLYQKMIALLWHKINWFIWSHFKYFSWFFFFFINFIWPIIVILCN